MNTNINIEVALP